VCALRYSQKVVSVQIHWTTRLVFKNDKTFDLTGGNHILMEQFFHLLAPEDLLQGDIRRPQEPSTAQADQRSVNPSFDVQSTRLTFENTVCPLSKSKVAKKW